MTGQKYKGKYERCPKCGGGPDVGYFTLPTVWCDGDVLKVTCIYCRYSWFRLPLDAKELE